MAKHTRRLRYRRYTANRIPSRRRLHCDHYEHGVWHGPTWCMPHVIFGWKDCYPRTRINGRWVSGLRASHMLFVGRHVNPPRKSREARQRSLQWRIAERCGAWRFETCPF